MNLGLVALARIQALEARPEAETFRAKWLDGKTLPTAEAISWLRRQLEAGADETSFEVMANKDGKYVWSGRREYDELVRHYTDTLAARDLAAKVLAWCDRYGWTDNDAFYFALTDQQPTLEPVERRVSSGIRLVGVGVTGPMNERITLVCRPQATAADVTAAYKQAQRDLLASGGLAPRERTKPMTSERRVDLAVIGARIYLHEFNSWASAQDAFNSEHAEGSARLEVAYREQNQKGLFRRDVRASFKQATGLDLDFKPDLRGGPARISIEWRDGSDNGQTASAPAFGSSWQAESKGDETEKDDAGDAPQKKAGAK